MQVLDGGRAFNGGNPPAELEFKRRAVANPQKDAPPQTILGAEQKAWFKDQLKRATATWKIWGNSQGTLELARRSGESAGRPDEAAVAGRPFANLGGGDHGSAWVERSEIYDLVRDAKITRLRDRLGRPSQLLGRLCIGPASARQVRAGGPELRRRLALQPGRDGGARAPTIRKDFPLRPLYLADRPGARSPTGRFNMLLRHGVRSCLEYAKTFDLERARALSNPALAPHLEFVDMGGHGYATVRLSGDEMRTEFVCIPRPITRSERPDGGPLRYRVVHTAKLWRAGEGRSSRSKCSKAIRALDLTCGARLTGGWYWQALSRRDGACVRLADRDRARVEAQRSEARHARRRCPHFLDARPRQRHRWADRRARLSRSPPLRSSVGVTALMALAYAPELSASAIRRARSRRWSRSASVFSPGTVSRRWALRALRSPSRFLALEERAARICRQARRARRQGARPLRDHRRRDPAVPAQRTLWPARRLEPAEAVAGGRAGHRLLVPRLCRQPHFRRAARDHRHGADRRSLQFDRGDPVARSAARQRGAGRRGTGRNRARDGGHVLPGHPARGDAGDAGPVRFRRADAPSARRRVGRRLLALPKSSALRRARASR